MGFLERGFGFFNLVISIRKIKMSLPVNNLTFYTNIFTWYLRKTLK